MFRHIPPVFVCVAAAFAGLADAAEFSVANPVELKTALASAAPGDAILLAPGDYGVLDFRRRRFDPAITISAADRTRPPAFKKILFVDVAGVSLSGLTVTYGQAATPLSSYAVDIRGGSNIELSGFEISSAANGVAGDDAYGVIIRDSTSVGVRDSRIHDVFRAIFVADSSAVEIRRNVILAVGSDGVAARGTIGLSVIDNYFADFRNVDPVRFHPDAIQLWSRGAARASENIVIRGNLIRRAAGDPSQGIFIKTPEIAARNVIIEHNVIEQSMGQGIAVDSVDGVIIRNNTVIPFDPATDRPGIDVRSSRGEMAIMDNIMIAARFTGVAAAAANDAAGFHHPDIAAFVAARMAGGSRRTRPEDYAPTGAAGAHDFVKDLWRGDLSPDIDTAP